MAGDCSATARPAREGMMGAVESSAAASMQFAAVVEASRQVAGTRSRRSKIATIANPAAIVAA